MLYHVSTAKPILRQLNKSGILLPKLFWPTVRKNFSSDRENFLKFEVECAAASIKTIFWYVVSTYYILELYTVLHMFTQVLFLARKHNNQKDWVPYMLHHNFCLISMRMKQIRFLNAPISHLKKKIWGLALENLEILTQMAWMWLNLYGCQAIWKKTFL